MDKFDILQQHIADTVAKFIKAMPGVNATLESEVKALISDLDSRSGKVAVSAENINKLAKMKAKIMSAFIDNPEYKKIVGELLKEFSTVTKLANDYFVAMEAKYKEPAIIRSLQRLAISSTIDSLGMAGIGNGITSGIYDILRANITSGGSYKDMQKQLTAHLTSPIDGEHRLVKWSKQIVTDSLNQYAANHTATVASSLGYNWFIYRNTLIETSRDFCIACKNKKYIHISEIPQLLKGEFVEFKDIKGRINPKTKLPYGMIPSTDSSNFAINRGGYNCGHQLAPVSDLLVPASLRIAIS